MALLTIQTDVHGSLIALSHLMSQCNLVGILMRICISKDRLSEEPCAVRMDEVTTVASQKHKIGIRIRMLC